MRDSSYPFNTAPVTPDRRPKRCEICGEHTSEQVVAACGHLAYICEECLTVCAKQADEDECARCQNKGDR